MNSGIYMILSPSGKVYIGSSRRLQKRKIRHFHDMRENCHHCAGLQRAWDKYGEQLVFSVLERCEEPMLIEREQWWMDNHLLFARGIYNSNPFAVNSGPLSDDHKALLSAINTGRKHTEETKMKMRKPKGEGFGAKVSRAKKGRPYPKYSDERRVAHALAVAKSWADGKRDHVSASVKASWNDERRRKHAEGFARRRIVKHIEMLDWIVGV